MRRHWGGILIGVGLAVLTVAACDTESEENDDFPAPTSAAVWEHLQEENYDQTWDLWPGTDELYVGSEPHGMLLSTYVNDAARQAISAKTGTMPEGAIVVKENYMPDTTFDAITVMYKVDGYNPENSDWFWLKVSPTGVVDAEGRVEGCQNCHSAAADNDFLFTSSIQ